MDLKTKKLTQGANVLQTLAQKREKSSLRQASLIIKFLEKEGHLKAGSITVLNGNGTKSKIDPLAHEHSDQMKIAIAAYELRNIAMKNGGISGKELAEEGKVPGASVSGLGEPSAKISEEAIKRSRVEDTRFSNGFPNVGFI